MKQSASGSCLCKSIKFEIDHMQPAAAHCHCSMCRKFHGALFASYGSAKREHFHWLCGEEHLKHFTAGNGTVRSFCGECGSSLFFYSPNAAKDIVEIALGTLDGDVPVQPDAHIFVDSASSCYADSDQLPKYSADRKSKLVPKV